MGKQLSLEEVRRIRQAFGGEPNSEDPRLNYAVETIQKMLASGVYDRKAERKHRIETRISELKSSVDGTNWLIENLESQLKVLRAIRNELMMTIGRIKAEL